MRSILATLRTLVLPGGATSGRRIVLDGVNGTITIFDAAGEDRIILGNITDPDQIKLSSGSSLEDFAGFIDTVANGNLSLRLLARSPDYGTGNTAELSLNSGSEDGTVGSAAVITADDLKLGAVSLPRGVVAYYEATANDVARAAGVNTNAFVTFTAIASRLYEITAKSQVIGGTAGVNYAIAASEGGTVGVNDGTLIERLARWNIAETPAGSLTLGLHASALYKPTAGSKTVRLRNEAASGGTLQLNAGAAISTQLWIKDIGAR